MNGIKEPVLSPSAESAQDINVFHIYIYIKAHSTP